VREDKLDEYKNISIMKRPVRCPEFQAGTPEEHSELDLADPETVRTEAERHSGAQLL
jgi:hypothetical protein